MHVQLANFFAFEKQRKTKIRRHPKFPATAAELVLWDAQLSTLVPEAIYKERGAMERGRGASEGEEKSPLVELEISLPC